VIQIVEVIGRSSQGITRPFVCRGEDGEIYFVKGAGAGRRSLICEWVAGNLGRDLGLPIPPFAVVEVPPELIGVGGMPDLADLGAGAAFGSQRHALIELPHTAVDEVPPELQWDVLAFDWWIRNGDRTLTRAGGNPNLFWDPAGAELLVLDHNQAFDPDFDPADFQSLHAFAQQIPALFGDLVRRAEYAKRLEIALGRWDEVLAGVPPAWYFADAEMTVPTPFDASAVFDSLTRCMDNDFWTLP
jgi:hypothetical protein